VASHPDGPALRRKAQFRADLVSAEAMGFHAPQQAARILGEAIEYARPRAARRGKAARAEIVQGRACRDGGRTAVETASEHLFQPQR
jgi:formate-dependent nitrite reductase cytochrome c552 subunit